MGRFFAATNADAGGLPYAYLTTNPLAVGGKTLYINAATKRQGELRVELLESLVRFTQGGGRKIDAWTSQHRCAIVPFDAPGDDASAFFNANTLAELQALESRSPT